MPPLLLLAACIGFFAWRAKHGMRFTTLGDETMHFLGAQVIARGGVLYRDLIDLHGPLAFAIPQAYGAVFGWAEPLNGRAIMLALMVAAVSAVGGSTSLRGPWERNMACALFIGLTTSLWLVQSLCLYDYQPVCGTLFVIGVALFVVPAWFGEAGGAARLVVSGVCLAAPCFMTFSYGPAALLLFASGAWPWVRRNGMNEIWPVLAGALAMLVAMLVWLAIYASFRGYLVFHFIHGIVDFGRYLQFGIRPAVAALWMTATPPNLAQIIGVVATLCGFLAFGASVRALRLSMAPVLLGLAGVILSNPRGSYTLQNGTFLILAFGVAALGLAQLPRRCGIATPALTRAAYVGAMALLIFGAEMTARQALSSPRGLSRQALHDLAPASLAQSDVPWAQQIRRVTRPDETILAVPYNPDVYALAGRLPMRRYLYYLPWDADYARHPWLGIQRDLCTDLAREPPPVIYYNGWIVWGRWDPRDYMPCLLAILQMKYQKLPGEPFVYVRNDRVARLKP
jgi:hypothetical protein